MKQRPIKFRVWYHDLKKMEYQSPFSSCLKHITWNGNIYKEGVLQNVHLLQFTGYLDLFNEELYEGDIVMTIYNTMGIIQFGHDNGHPTYAGWTIKEGPNCFRNFSCVKQVLGNMYEDPEVYEVINNSKINYKIR